MKKLLFCVVHSFILLYATAQTENEQATQGIPDSLLKYSYKKSIPDQYKLSVLTALSYFHELQNLSVKIRIKQAYTPLSTKPDFKSMFKRKSKRTYIITVSNKTIDTLVHLLYKNLNLEERIGIIGHELSHVVDFDSKNFFQSLNSAIRHISKRYLDKMEFKTDSICISHGLGTNLEAYSKHVRESMHVHYWRGVDHVFEKDEHIERYMIKARATTLPK